MKIDDLRLTIDDLEARRGKVASRPPHGHSPLTGRTLQVRPIGLTAVGRFARSWKNCKLYLVLCTLFWWLDAYAEEIAKAILYILLGALAAPFVLYAACAMYENAVRDDEPVTEAYWLARGYEPLNTLPPTDEQ